MRYKSILFAYGYLHKTGFIIEGSPEQACIADLIYLSWQHKPWITAGFVNVCCSMSMVKQNFSGAYECYYAWPLPEANPTTLGDLTVYYTVCEQPALVCHGPQSHSVDPLVWS